MKPYLRLFSRATDVTVEICQRTLHGRYLTRPDPEFNQRAVGVLAKAQTMYGVRLHAFTTLSSHLHLLATFDDAEQMARFCCHVFTNLSKLVGRFYDWPGTVFPEPYHHVELSREPEVEAARLKYVLGQGCKENLVASPLDWPGASSTRALVRRDLANRVQGEWVDGTALAKARSRGSLETERDFMESVEVELSPIPSLAHLTGEQYRGFVVGLVREIEQETEARHRSDGTRPLGIVAILAVDPHTRPAELEKSVQPWFFALDPLQRQALATALSWIVASYREAAALLKEVVAGGGDPRTVQFPVGTFPPGLPFVRGKPRPEPG